MAFPNKVQNLYLIFLFNHLEVLLRQQVFHYDDLGSGYGFLILKDFDENFRWHFDGSRFIPVGTNSNAKMDVHNWITNNCAKVQVWTVANTDNQKWNLISRGHQST